MTVDFKMIATEHCPPKSLVNIATQVSTERTVRLRIYNSGAKFRFCIFINRMYHKSESHRYENGLRKSTDGVIVGCSTVISSEIILTIIT